MKLENMERDFLAGFTLAGYEQPDGTIISTTGKKMEKWPDEITIYGITFTLELVNFAGRPDNPKGRFVNAEYV